MAVFTVNVDTDNAPLGPGVGSGSVGDLRYAILQATLNPGPDEIRFSLPANTTLRPNTGPASMWGPTAFQISDLGSSFFNNQITIDGSGSPGLTIDGQAGRRLFHLSGDASTVSLKLKNLTIANGLAEGGNGGSGGVGGGGGAGLGGAIYVSSSGRFTAEGVTFFNNVARGGRGGDGRSDTLNGSGSLPVPFGLSAGGGGGGIGSAGQNGSLFPSEVRGGDGGGPRGGSGGNQGGIPNLIIGAGGGGGTASGGGGGGYDITFGGLDFVGQFKAANGGRGGFGGGGGGGPAGGGAGGYGGGAGGSASNRSRLDLFGGEGGSGFGGAIYSDGGIVILANSTFYKNTAAGGAGGVTAGTSAQSGIGVGGAVAMRNGSLTAVFTTFSNNTASSFGSSVSVFSDTANVGLGAGTGIAEVILTNNLIGQSENKGFDFFAAAFNGAIQPIVVGTKNFVSRHSGLPTALAINAQGADPLIGGFRRNSGPTNTIAPRPGSPLLDAGAGVGTASYADLTIDQSGATRDGAPSIGAVESILSATRTYVVNTTDDLLDYKGQVVSPDFTTISNALTLRDALTAIITGQPSGWAPAGLDTNTITFDPSLSNRKITLDPILASMAPGFVNRYGKSAFTFSEYAQITIDASNAPGLTIDANNAKRIFSVSNSAELTIRNLTLANGFSNDDDNVFTPTTATGMGGAVRVDNRGTFTAEKSLFLNNRARGEKGPAFGGAIFSSDSVVNLVNSTFVGNSLTRDFFGPFHLPLGVDVLSTEGGAVFVRNGTLNSQFVTFTNNTAIDGDSIVIISDSNSGNGYFSGTAQANISHSILGQAADSGSEFIARTHGTAATPILSGSNNYVRNNPATQGLRTTALHPASGSDPRLGPIGNYGGNTRTVPLLANSPLSTPATSLPTIQATDQRGKTRPGGIAANQMFVGAFEPQRNVATTVGLVTSNSTYRNTSVTATVLAVGGVGQTGLSGVVAFDYLSGGSWVFAGTAPVNSNGQSAFAFNSLPAGVAQVRARYTSNSPWFADSNSAPFSFSIAPAQVNIFYDFGSESVQARGVSGENFNSGLTIYYSNDGGVSFASTPPAATGYAVYYTLVADANHQNVTTRTFLGNVARIIGEKTQVLYDGQPHAANVRAIGISGEDLTRQIRLYYQPVSENGVALPIELVSGDPNYTSARSIGFYRAHYFSFFSSYLNPSPLVANTGATLMIHDPNRVVDLAVTTLVDENDGTWYPAVGSGLSLREAMEYANFHAGPDTITFSPGLSGTLNLNGSPLPNAQSNLTITGPGADRLSISGNSRSGILTAVGSSIQISGLSLTGGSAIVGGALTIDNGASVAIDSSDLSNNRATGSGTTNADGGAILNRGTLTIRNSSIRNNNATNGGAIYNANGSQLIVENSTLAGNAASFGGGVDNFGTASFLNSTIADNRSNGGGGIRATIGVNASTTIINTILGRNTDFAGTAPQDFAGSGSFSLQSKNNLIGVGGSGGLFNGVNGNIVAGSVVALGLGTLSSNGGRTQTIPLLTGSPAINAGNNASASHLNYDQRGVGNPRRMGSTVDIGAFELTQAPSLVSVTVNGGDAFINLAQRSQVTSLVVAFDSPVTLRPGAFTIADTGLVAEQAPVALSASQIVVSGSGTTYTITFNGGPGVVQRLLSFGLGRGNSLADGNYLLTIDPTKVASVNGGLALSPTNSFGDGDNEFGDLAVDNFFRLYGDADGNGIVNSLDTGAFAKALTNYNAALDYDSNGLVQNSGVDRTNFLANFNKRRRTFS